MVRLGAGGLDGRALTPEAMQAALQVLSKFRRLAESHSVDEIVAVATSAVREAENGGEFLKAAASQTGIRARVISGTEEARLIHLAAAYGVGAPGEVLVVIDIGGGSVEITRGAGSSLEMGRSFKLGVIRLTERFVKSDPISPRDERKLVRHIEAELGEYLDGSSAPASIGWSARRARSSASARSPPGSTAARRRRRCATAACPAKQLRRVRRTMTSLSLEKRLRVPGLDPRRADLSPAGAILLDTIVRRLGADASHALRPVAARRARPRLHRAAPQGDRAGRSLSRRPPPQRHRARRALQLLARARAADRAAGDGAVRPDARHPRPDRPRARVAGVRGAAPRHRRPHQLRAAPQALVLPDPQRRPARLRAGRDRDHRARRPLPSPRRRRRRSIRCCAASPGPAAARFARWPRCSGWPRASIAATRRRSPASSCTIAATMRCCRCGRGDAELELWAAQPPRRALRAPDRQAAARRSEQDDDVC